jgi:pantoate--beta-alanine ligase
LAADLNINTRIFGVPTVRETDGLALSSRNQYLSVEERATAPRLNQVLRHSAFVMKNEGRPVADTLEKAKVFLLDAGFSSVDYVALCNANSLAPLSTYQPRARLLVAAWLGKTRLIDNIEVE